MRKLRRKYKSPRTPWDSIQIKDERKLLNEFGLRRKREMWRAQAILRNFRRRARILIAAANKEQEKVLLERLKKLGFVTKKDATLDDVLALTLKDVLNRRLQTIVFRKGAAKTMRHARQMITHGHVYVGERRTLHPSYIVATDEEGMVSFRRHG